MTGQQKERQRCLIAEDNIVCRSILSGFLNKHYECDFAVNGQEAFELYKLSHNKKKPYQLVCLDVVMPVVDGLEALHKIRCFEKDIAVPPNMEVKAIMISALSSPSTVFKAMYRSGAHGYVIKPVKATDLNTQLVQAGLPSVSPIGGL
ncbi:response regulator (plasmid) [Trichlorobacter lovleyi]|uniref:response regulator n=1 Tax=Trichlorobacter lovleyi TaxID=313985 RepID=UPI00223F287B|nr:response regulator [Trichlorobacter lovleyi]QOX80774.1 response regulator [Trichlorobacter lovleyi]